MEKGGLKTALAQAGLNKGATWLHMDEMRFGLWGQVRRRWGLRGVKIAQKVQIVYAWRYLVLGVNSITGKLQWGWTDRMCQDDLMPVLADWSMEAVIWDGASSHRGKKMATMPFQRIALPPYSPELNPPERVFREIRREIEGIVYPSLQAKQQAIDQFLRKLARDKARVKRLVGWDWIHCAYMALPDLPD